MAKAQRKNTVAPETQVVTAEDVGETSTILAPTEEGTPDGVTVTEVAEVPAESLGEVVQITDMVVIDSTTGENVGEVGLIREMELIPYEDPEVALEQPASNAQVENTDDQVREQPTESNPEVAIESTSDDEDDTPTLQDDPLPTVEELKAAGLYVPEDGPVAIVDAAALKYANRQEKLVAAKSVCTPGWPYANAVFVIGSHKPQRDSSVMGKIYNVVARHKDGIRGEDLIRMLRDPRVVQFDNVKSTYCQGGIPVAAWLEDYCSGGSRVVYSHWKIKTK